MHDAEEFTGVQYGIAKFEGMKAAKLDIEAVDLFLKQPRIQFREGRTGTLAFIATRAQIRYYRL